MDIKKILDRAAHIEEQMADVYREICQTWQDESLLEGLLNLSQDEIDHKNMLITGKNYVSEVPEVFSLFPKTEEMMEVAMVQIDNLKDMIRKKSSLKEIFDEAIRLEMLFTQFHMKMVVNIKDKSLKQLFETLSQDDQEHVERLKKLRASLN